MFVHNKVERVEEDDIMEKEGDNYDDHDEVEDA